MTRPAAPEGIPFLSRARLEALAIPTEEVVDSIERMIAARRAGRVWAAPKSVLLPDDGRYMMSTLAAADDPPVMAVKSLLLNPRNRDRGLPDINALVTLLHSETGLPLAVLEGNWVTEVRTAGLSAVAARRLARPDASRIAFIGCGAQARSHLAALRALFPLKELHAFGRGVMNRDALCQTAWAAGLAAVASPTARAALEDADIVVTSVTLSHGMTAFLDARWLKPGACALIVDLGLPWDPAGMPAFDRIVIDDLAQEAAMPTPMVDAALVRGDLAGLVCGDVPGRTAPDERTAFVFRGMALGDLAVAALGWQRSAG